MTDEQLAVEVFPIALERWVAVIEGASGPFSTEASTPEGVEAAVATAIGEVLGSGQTDFRLVDPKGNDWTVDMAARQAAELGR
ncbi:MAG: hypothetical protein JWP11_935 [Frankiales bacterium]|nr:hypothetical protein [Frankiales bacterium]